MDGITPPPPASAADAGARRFIYIACPWTPVGGGMFKVADYLIQSQATTPLPQGARLAPLDTRGAGSAVASLGVLGAALARIARARLGGRLGGVHVNMAERLSLVRKSVVIGACRLLGVPVVLHLHAAQLHRAWPRLPAPARAVVRYVFSLPRCCIVLGRESADFVAGELRVPRGRITVVTNGVPAPSLPRRVAGGMPTLLFVGNLSDRKGVPELLAAMADPALAAGGARLVLAGGGDIAAYQAQAARLGVQDRVRFAGWTDQAGVARLLAQADALVLPSHDEGLPLAILEALAQGVAVVCTPVGEIPHVLTDGTDALFVPPGDARALAAGLVRVLGDDALRAQLEHNGQALWRREFSMDRFFDQVAAVHQRHFGTCASRGPAPGPEPGGRT